MLIMKKSITWKLVTSTCLAVSILAACGKDNKSENPQSGNPSGKNTPLSSQQAKESYRFVLNGCDTGKHEFTGTDSDSVNKQLCDALQDDKLNNSCAEALRLEFFNKKCSGYSWTPRYENSSPSHHGGGVNSNPLPSTFRNYEKEQKIRDALSNLLVDSAQVSSNMTDAEAQSVQLFIDDIKICGLSYVGPKCAEYVTTRGSYVGSLYEVDKDNLFVVELKIKGIGVPVLFAFDVDADGQTYKSGSFKIYKELRPFSGQVLKDYLADKESAIEVASAKLAANTLETALDRLQSPKDIRELFHLADTILEITRSGSSQEIGKKVTAGVVKQKALVIGSDNTDYQYRILSLMVDKANAPKTAILSLCDGLISSKDANLKQMAATYVLDYEPSRNDVKPLVRQALNQQRWDVRRRAITGLNKSQPSDDDQNLIIAKMDDSDEDVRKEAVNAANTFSLTSAHLSSLSQLLKSNNWDVRRNATRLLAKISDGKATSKVIAQMNDSDEDVRKEAFDQLNKQQLGSDMVPSLTSNLSSNNWAVRRDSIKLLGKISGDESTIALIKQMGDTDEDVRAQVGTELGRKKLSEKMINPLVEKFSSNNWAVRKNSAHFIGTISGTQASVALINQMNDSDEDVRKEIMDQLQKRSLSDETVPTLKTNFSSNNWTVRRDIAKLLGKIKGQKSLAALLDQLQVETDSDVKQQISTSIAAVRE